ncbi:hypothetical protein MASR2M70_02940 [Bacillota bacterium]
MGIGLKYAIAFVIILTLFATACSGGGTSAPGSEDNAYELEGILIHESSILITKSKVDQLPEGRLISLSFPAEMRETPPIGSLYSYEIGSTIRESWPPQADAIKAEEIREFAGHTVISFDSAEMILGHLPQNSHLIDVRTTEEFESGYVSGAQNIPMDEIESAILTVVPEKTDVIIVYCRSGNRSAQAGNMLEVLGYKVILDAGGIIDYKGGLLQ